MKRDELIETLRSLVDKEQEMYGMYKKLAEEVEDEDLREFFGFMSHEEYSHLNTIMDKYQKLIDASQQ